MSSYLAELERRWLTTGLDHLLQLVDITDISLTRKDCGFDQSIQRKLRKFDGNNDIGPRGYFEPTPATSSPLRGNVRGKLGETREIFRQPDNGGLQYNRAFRGLEVLEEVEIHRQHLLRDTRAKLKSLCPDDHSSRVLEQLHTHATEHYKAIQLGFRSMCLTDILPTGSLTQHDAAKVMARLNTLFPPEFTDFSDSSSVKGANLSPCTPGLRDSIRFCVYRHLMSCEVTPHQEGQPFKDKFSSRCSIPTYEKAREKLCSYIAEAKKTELTCLAVLHAIEARSSTIALEYARPLTPSNITDQDGSKSPESTPATPGSSNAYASDTSTIADASITSIRSSIHTSVTSISSSNLTPLLKGMPGRELSASKTDGAAFSMDLTAPDVLVYPNDLSQTEFHVHPLAKYLDWDNDAKAHEDDSGGEDPAPTAAAARTTRKKGKLSKRRGKQSDELPPAPPLPPIPEAFKSATTPKLFGRLLERIRKESESVIAANGLARDSKVSKKSETTSALRAAKGRKKVSLKSQISDPTPSHVGSLPLVISFDREAKLERSLSEGSIPSPIVTDWAAVYQEQDFSSAPFTFTLARPRLSPMEYTRMYMIHQAGTRRNGQKCRFPAPQKEWFWTPRWEKFLIVPRIPHIIKRCDSPERLSESDLNLRLPALRNSAVFHTPSESMAGCPRLSLHLGGIITLMPSVMNLTAVGISNAVASYDPAIAPRRRSRRHSMSSDGKRTSLTTLTENETWSPSRWDDAPRFAWTKNQSAHQGLDQLSLATRHGFFTNPSPRAREQLSLTGSRVSSLSAPTFRTPSHNHGSLHPAPLFSRNIPSQDTHLVASAMRCKPLKVDGLTPGRIRSVAASIWDDTGSGDSDVISEGQHSPELPSNSHRRSEKDDSDKDAAITTNTTRTAPQYSPRFDNRRHSMHVRTPVSFHTRHASLESVLGCNGQFSSSPSTSSSFLVEDPFLDTHHDMAPSSSYQQLRQQAPHTPLPDSPTLGQEKVFVASEAPHQPLDRSFELLGPYMDSKQRHEIRQTQKLDSFLPCGDPVEQVIQLPSHSTRPSNRRGGTAHHGYSSSFALNRAKSHEAFTLLPRLAPSTTSSTSKAVQGENPHDVHSPEELVRLCAVSDRSTALALRNHDTASRLASVAGRNGVQQSAELNIPAVPEKEKSGQRRTTFGSLFIRHGRRRSCSRSHICPEDDSVPESVSYTIESEQTYSRPEGFRNMSEPLQLHRQGGLGLGSSHASNNSSLAGLKEKLKLRRGKPQL
ncbi:hypothetical protein EsDP_00001548 [Epichloe bromicola]|uniref:Uncharacterized protein n=1 Tax=Epichloe bromicola TaxID=79588 RepID=A0ABQ0CI63_9HYPO